MKLTVVKKKSTFEDYFIIRHNAILLVAKQRNITVEEYLRNVMGQTPDEYKERQLKNYNKQECHSFWRRECVNKDIECHHCKHYYSTAEWDKMSIKKRNEIKNG
jgi:hypothetical protein